MPKASKKKKEKAADFTKAKLKLGKGKKLPTNAIDTSFKARSVALPTQTIALDRDASVPTTKRKLSLDELFAHLKHHNANARKDALLGLRELFTSNPELVQSKLTATIGASVKLVSDEDAGVRKAFIAFLQWLLSRPQIQPDTLAPHTPLFMLFVTSAQTHIFPEIRIDAIHALDVLLDAIPDAVVEGWADGSTAQAAGGGEGSSGKGPSHGSRALRGYLGILNVASTFGQANTTTSSSAASVATFVLSAKSKLAVLESFSTFLRAACRPSDSSADDEQSIPTWYLASSFASDEAYRTFDDDLRPTALQRSKSAHCVWQLEEDGDDEDYTNARSQPLALAPLPCDLTWDNLHAPEETDDDDSNAMSLRSTFITHLALALHPLMLSTFLDCAPAAFLPGHDIKETELRLVLAVAEIARTLYGQLLQDRWQDPTMHDCFGQLQNLLVRMVPYFPFAYQGPKGDIKTEQRLHALNLIYSELASLLALSDIERDRTASSSKSAMNIKRDLMPKKRARVSSQQLETINTYATQLLRGGSMGSGVGSHLTAAAYAALLPSMWSLLCFDTTTESDISGSIVDHALRISSTSPTKRATVEFLGRLVLLRAERQYVRDFYPLDDKQCEEWILHLPKTLWELGSRDLPLTEIILRLLLRLAQRRVEVMNTSVLEALCQRLALFFTVSHPEKGCLPGPFARLPDGSAVRKLALDLGATLLVLVTGAASLELHAAVDSVVLDLSEATYWKDIVR